MEKYIFDESNGLWYELQGDYYIPCLTFSDGKNYSIGIWGQRHKKGSRDLSLSLCYRFYAANLIMLFFIKKINSF